jgi:hypothetical protein
LRCGCAKSNGPVPTRQEDKAMKEELVVITGVLVSAAVCTWYVVQAVAGVVHPIPTDDMCTTVTQCLALALGQ